MTTVQTATPARLPEPTECEDGCGNAVEIVLEDSDDASGYKGSVFLCKACWERRHGAHGR